MIAFSWDFLYNVNVIFPGVAQLVGRLIWELEHSLAQFPDYVLFSLVYLQIRLFCPLNNSANWSPIFPDHIFDHIWMKLNILSGLSEVWYRAWFGSWSTVSASPFKMSDSAHNLPKYPHFPLLKVRILCGRILLTTCLTTSGKISYRKSGYSPVGRAGALGASGRAFESRYSDQWKTVDFARSQPFS